MILLVLVVLVVQSGGEICCSNKANAIDVRDLDQAQSARISSPPLRRI